MKFKKETIQDFANADAGIFIKRCQHYTLLDNDNVIGHFYCGVDHSIGILNDTYFTIRQRGSSLTKRVFELQNINNNVIVGQLTISNFVALKSLKISLDLIHKETYKWEVVESLRGGSLFTSSYSKFLARVFNDQEELIIRWNYKGSQFWKYRLEELPIEGELELKDSKNHYLLFAGLFLSEMELQMKSVDQTAYNSVLKNCSRRLSIQL